MIQSTEALLSDLIERTRQHLNQAEKMKRQPLPVLNHKSDPATWSALECIEHLNLYGDFYLPEIEKQIKRASSPPEARFKSGWLGNYFAMGMLPQEKGSKMKTFKDKNPNGQQLDKAAIDRFIHQQQRTLNLLDQARGISLNKTKTGVSISPWIKLKLGDTFRVVIYHNHRHLQQASRALSIEPLRVS